MSGSLYLAWQYIRCHRGTTATLVAAITLIVYLPAALETIVDHAAEHLSSRADSTPLVVGARGSELELVLASVYFDRTHDDIVRMEQLQRLRKQNLGQAIPLHTRFQARDCPLVGTTATYAKLRNLRIAKGRMWDMLGECVIGSRVAEKLSADVGDKIPLTTKSAFTLDDAPLRLNVVGRLAATETPDDDVIFVDIKTAWVAEGLGHGHAPDAKHGSPEATPFTDITEENVGSFHFHGDKSQFPITAVIVVPDSEKAETLLLGQYLSPDDTLQIVRPADVMDALLAKVLMVRSYLIAITSLVSCVTLLTISLVVVLSIRLRHGEIATMSKMGCSRFTISSILGSQIAIILAISAAIATVLTLITDVYGAELVRFFIL
jgi:putative ABC transport system permease protein